MDKKLLDQKALESKILIVDDMIPNAVLLEQTLLAFGFKNVKFTTDSRKVMTMIEQMNPDILFLDLLMPFLDGFQLMESIRLSDYAALPIIVITAQNDRINHKRALEFGAKDFIGKPFDNIEIIMRLRNVLDNKILLDHIMQLEEKLSIKEG